MELFKNIGLIMANKNIISIKESQLRSLIENAINEIGDTEAGQSALGALHAKKVYNKVRDDYKKSGLIKGHITTDDEKRVLDYKENAKGLGENNLKRAIRESIQQVLKENAVSEEQNILTAFNAMKPYVDKIAEICNNAKCTMPGIDNTMFQIINSINEIPKLAKYFQTAENLDEQFGGGYGYNSSREIWTAEDVEDCFTNDEIMDIIEKILGVSDVNSISDYDAYLGIIADKLTEKNLSYNAIMELINNE